MKKNCLYAEIDPYTGSIAQSKSALKALLIDLKIACLLYDSVIVQTSVFFEHTLCLPAFIHLAPFVESGVLWASTKNSKIPPEAFILKRAEKYFGQDLNRGISKTASEKLKHHLDVWSSIAPPQWQHTRQMQNQIQSATDNILSNFEKLSLSKQGEYCKALLSEFFLMMQEDQVFDRNQSLAKIGSMRELVTQQELSLFYLIVQGEYTLQGSSCNNTPISLYPGRFIKIIQQNSVFIRESAPIPVELDIIEKAKVRLNHCGFSFSKILNMPVDRLFQLSQSKEWKLWRNYLLSDRFNDESMTEMRSLNKVHDDLLTVLAIHLKNIDHSKQSDADEQFDLLIPNTWFASGLSLTGCLSSIEKVNSKQTAILNMNTRTILFMGEEACLQSKFHTNVIVLLASTANEGLPIEIIKQQDLEFNFLKNRSRYFKKSLKVNQSSGNEVEKESRLNRINVHKNNLNQKLSKLDLQITGKNSRWQLVRVSTNTPITLVVQGTPWEQNIKTQFELLKPHKLTKQQNLIWEFCSQRPFYYFSFKALAIELKRHFFEADEVTAAEVSKILNRFSKEVLNKTNYQLLSDQSGNYCFTDRGEISHEPESKNENPKAP